MSAPEHLLELIRQAKPKAALLTSYTFSVSHFDAVMLPALRSVGCQDIAVLVDANEAARCASESSSRAAGRLYRVAPVVAPGGGVFHPKLVYLAGDDDDVLAISSGNLTASGQSLQLESFDAVAASSAPDVFNQWALWAEHLAALVRQTSPQAAELLEGAAPRARELCTRHAAPAQFNRAAPILVHTLVQSAREQLQALFLARHRTAKRVTVLSPFHAPDAGPVLRLAKTLEAEFLEIGLDGSRSQLVAPFEAARFKPRLPGRFVLPDTSRSHRRLHAKVFELHGTDEVLVMTGSVNATAQSLESTKNVEVSLARWLGASPFSWNPVEPTGYAATQEPSEFEPPPRLVVEAWLTEDRTLRGQVTARVALPAALHLTLSSDGCVLYEAPCPLDAHGGFDLGTVPVFNTTQAILLDVPGGVEAKRM